MEIKRRVCKIKCISKQTMKMYMGVTFSSYLLRSSLVINHINKFILNTNSSRAFFSVITTFMASFVNMHLGQGRLKQQCTAWKLPSICWYWWKNVFSKNSIFWPLHIKESTPYPPSNWHLIPSLLTPQSS